MNSHGIFIVSLDFELNWGVHDCLPFQKYKENIYGARKVIPKILELFNEFGIHGTWATVGMLFYDNKKTLLENLPSALPRYKNTSFSAYNLLSSIGENETSDPYHYGLTLLKQIKTFPNQEIATHTFSHYYCLEEGQTIHEFTSDLEAAFLIANNIKLSLKSIVFPRNQTNPDYYAACKEKGLVCFRGNEESWVYKASRFKDEGIIKKILRTADCFINIFGHHTYSLTSVQTEPIVNLPSSRFLRPYNVKLQIAEPLRLKRIKDSMTYAAQKGEVFHLWWHPHNFGKNIDENISFLIEVLKHANDLREKYDFKSMSMHEASTLALQYAKKSIAK